jgi:hypothetical protein
VDGEKKGRSSPRVAARRREVTTTAKKARECSICSLGSPKREASSPAGWRGKVRSRAALGIHEKNRGHVQRLQPEPSLRAAKEAVVADQVRAQLEALQATAG